MKFKVKNSQLNYTLETTAFTSGGEQLIEALQVPSNIEYFEWFAKKLEGYGFSVELFVFGIRENSAAENHEVQGRIERYSIPTWPP